MYDLPELFQEIIKHDNSYPEVGNVVGFSEYKSWKQKRIGLSIDAERFIAKQRAD